MKIAISSLENIAEAAQQFLHNTKNKSKVIAFHGEMGAGKTTFIKALSAELGVFDNVTSPTFSIVNEYHTNSKDSVFHFDFYRIDDLREAVDMGYQDYFDSGKYCFIEWPEKIEPLLPDDILHVEINIEDDNSRSILVKE